MTKSDILNMTVQQLNDLTLEIMHFETSDYLPERLHRDWFPASDIRDAMKLQNMIYQHDLAGYYIERMKETFDQDKNMVGTVALMNATAKQRIQAALMAWFYKIKEGVDLYAKL
jgi:hypothetical protein